MLLKKILFCQNLHHTFSRRDMWLWHDIIISSILIIINILLVLIWLLFNRQTVLGVKPESLAKCYY